MTGGTGAAEAADIRFVTRHIGPESAAAVTAVVLAAIEEQRSAVQEAPAAPSAWVRSAQLRTPIAPGPGRWMNALR